MENSKTKSRYKSTEELIAKMKLTFSNAKDTEILPTLKTVGYTEEKLNSYIEKVQEIEQLTQKQKKEYGEQYEETEKLNAKRGIIDEVYRKHLALSKIIFKKDIKAQSTLGLTENKKRSYAEWHIQVANFYAQLFDNQQFLEKVKSIGMTEEQMKAQQTALEELKKIREKQKKETGEAQKATETRDIALDEIYPIYKDLVAFAKVLLKGNQALEKLGIVVKR